MRRWKDKIWKIEEMLHAVLRIYTGCGKKVSQEIFLQFSQQSLGISKWNFTYIFSLSCTHRYCYYHSICELYYEVISITLLPPSDFCKLKHLHTNTHSWNRMQSWLWNNFLDFIAKEMWLSNSLELNSLDYCVYGNVRGLSKTLWKC